MFDKELHLYKIPAKPTKHNLDINLAWIYPNSYAVGMTGLGYQLIWWLLEQEQDLSVYRVFTDLAQNGWQKSELIGFTLSWELDYANILSFLSKLSIPLFSVERDDDCPYVFGGGPVLSANPEAFAEFFDIILLGDAEKTIPTFINEWRQVRQIRSRKERLIQLAKVEGVYIPSLYKYEYVEEKGAIASIEPTSCLIPANPKKQVFIAPDQYVAHSRILAKGASWGDMFLIELVRSCPQECRFCLASYLTRPFRGANLETVLAVVDHALKYTKRIGFLGPSVTEYAQFPQLAEALILKPDLEVSIASIRMDTINPLILNMLVKRGQRSLTIALESGSERLRKIMKKNLSDDEIWQGMELIALSGIDSLKFYGIVGLPGEIEEDLEDTVSLLTALKKKFKRLRLILGLSSFVPKAQTPFQWSGREKNVGKKIEFLKKNLAKIGIEVRAESHNWSDIQSFLSRADRRVAPKLIELGSNSSKLGAWKNAFKHESSSCPSFDYYAFREIPQNEILPWAHLVDDSKQIMLKKQIEQAYKLHLESKNGLVSS